LFLLIHSLKNVSTVKFNVKQLTVLPSPETQGTTHVSYPWPPVVAVLSISKEITLPELTHTT